MFFTTLLKFGASFLPYEQGYLPSKKRFSLHGGFFYDELSLLRSIIWAKEEFWMFEAKLHIFQEYVNLGLSA